MGRSEEPQLDDVIFERIYGHPRVALLDEFFQEHGRTTANRISLYEQKEFTYWLFKYRVKHSDKARLASDTKKGLDFLRSLGRGFSYA